MRRPLMVFPTPPEGGLVQCTDCAKCCTYVAVGINPPSRARWATDILWYLYHEGVSVYLDGDGEWVVQFEARCRHLAHDRLCGIYPHRPHICRSFDNRTCEVNEPGGGTLFETPEQFLEYMKKKRPRLFRQIAREHVPTVASDRGRSTDC
jgi:uncharacterized protein